MSPHMDALARAISKHVKPIDAGRLVRVFYGTLRRSCTAACADDMKGRFSNWVFGSSSFSFFLFGSLSLIRVTLLFAV